MKEYFEALSADTEINLFISYKWNEMSEKEADKVCEWLSTYQINPIRDKYRLKYGDSINAYMDSIKKCNGAILIISDDYFFSINCMYEGIIAMQECKNKVMIRRVENSVFSIEFRKKIKEFWENFDATGIFGDDKEKLEKVLGHYQEFVFWISDTNANSNISEEQLTDELKKHIAKIELESFSYDNMIQDLISSKEIVISKVCDPIAEERYHYRNISYSIHASFVDYFKGFYDFVLSLEKIDTGELVDIVINNVVGIQEGNWGEDFSKYYFVIPKQESLDELAFAEKIGKEKSEVEYDKRRIIVRF